MVVCNECKNGIHKHMELPKGINRETLSRSEYLGAIDCKNIVDDNNNQCICPLWKKEYDNWRID